MAEPGNSYRDGLYIYILWLAIDLVWAEGALRLRRPYEWYLRCPCPHPHHLKGAGIPHSEKHILGMARSSILLLINVLSIIFLNLYFKTQLKTKLKF